MTASISRRAAADGRYVKVYIAAMSNQSMMFECGDPRVDRTIGTDCNPYAVEFHNLTQRMARPDKVAQVAALRDEFRKQLA